MSLSHLITESVKDQERKEFFEEKVFTEEELSDNEKLYEILTETVKATIPDSLQKRLAREEVREEMLEKYGKKAFLIPEEKKFPVVHPDTGEYNCKLIYAARIRAAQYDYKEVENKAIELYEKQGCEEKININVEEHDSSYDVAELINLLDLDFKKKE